MFNFRGVIRTDDGTFLIQPLKSGDGQVCFNQIKCDGIIIIINFICSFLFCQVLDDHVLFNANDVNEQVASCGMTLFMH